MALADKTKKAYRYDMEIKAEILQFLILNENGVNAGALSRCVNLSHYKVLEHAADMSALGLIEIKKPTGRIARDGFNGPVVNGLKIYKVTDAGRVALLKYKDVRNLFILRKEGQKASKLDDDASSSL